LTIEYTDTQAVEVFSVFFTVHFASKICGLL